MIVFALIHSSIRTSIQH